MRTAAQDVQVIEDGDPDIEAAEEALRTAEDAYETARDAKVPAEAEDVLQSAVENLWQKARADEDALLEAFEAKWGLTELRAKMTAAQKVIDEIHTVQSVNGHDHEDEDF